ncbi:MAG: hypothetical protein KF904_14900 [Rhodoblastus sp.]|nr:hypothetical protein [Rhodoblastus sp.]
MELETQTPASLPPRQRVRQSIDIKDLGDRLLVTVEIPVGPEDTPSRRRALAKAWEALAAAISETKAKLPPVPVPKRKRAGPQRGMRTGSGSWWQF